MELIGLVLVVMTLSTTIYLSILAFSYIFLPVSNIEVDDNEEVKVAVVVPAHNERVYIERCINSLKNCYKGQGSVEIIVVADNCTDETATRARALEVEVLERNDKEKIGKGYALNYAFEKYKNYDLYIVIDADTIVVKSFIIDMINGYKKGYKAMQGAYFVKNRVTNRNKLMNLALLIFHGVRPSAKEKLGLSVGIFGNGFALSRELIDRVNYDTFSIVEDLEYHIKLIYNEEKVHYIEEAKVYADFPMSKEGINNQRARWEGGRFYLMKKYVPRLIREVLKGKGRLWEPLLDLLTLPLANYSILLLLNLITPYYLYSFYGFFICFLFVVLGIYKFGDKADIEALVMVPNYLFWKLINLPKVIKHSSKKTKWKRTERD